jgi:hypothetical protein
MSSLPSDFTNFEVRTIFEMRICLKATIREISNATGRSTSDVVRVLNNPNWRLNALADIRKTKREKDPSPKRKHSKRDPSISEIAMNDNLETRIIGQEAEKVWKDRMGTLRWDIKRPEWAIPQT